MNKASFGRFNITEIPERIEKIELTRVFSVIAKLFIREKKREYKKQGKEFTYKIEDLIWNDKLFREFEIFESKMIRRKKIDLDEEVCDKYEDLIENFKERCNYVMRSSTKYYLDIYEILFLPLGMSKSDVKTIMLQFNNAYHMMKDVFHMKKRESKDEETGEFIRYFDHLKETMEIILYELPFPNMDKILTALLHDVREDIPGIRYKTLEVLFGKNVADGVEELSKKDWRKYFTEDEKKKFINLNLKVDIDKKTYKEMKIIAKKRRTKDYFWHLHKLDEDDLDVKFADRIHNLRTLDHCDIGKIVKKIIETEKYFMDLAYIRKQDTIREAIDIWNWRSYPYDLMKIELDRLKSDFHIYAYYRKKMLELENK